jgi:uroporphyrinogen decarboxylase
MSRHIDQTRRAIEFGSPEYIPMELVDIPHIYDAYDTLNREEVIIPAGAENFDAAWCTYHWTFKYLGKNEQDEPLRIDEWGCKQTIPHEKSGAYAVVEKPLPADTVTMEDVLNHPWPDPQQADGFFETRRKIIEEHYSDRWITGFLDPGPFLVAFNLFGYDGLLTKLHDDLDVVKEVLRRIHEYQKALVPKFKEMGAHMINIIDELAGTAGMMFSPEIWREHFRPMLADLLATIHKHGMYTSILLDGNISKIMPDLMEMELDQQFFAQPSCVGIEKIAKFTRGKRNVKLAVDMMGAMATGTAQQIKAQVDEYVTQFNTDKGGLIFQAFRWHRPEYAAQRVKAQIEAMNAYRPNAK